LNPTKSWKLENRRNAFDGSMEYPLAVKAGKAAAIAIVPTAMAAVFLLLRSDHAGGVRWLVVDSFSSTGIVMALGLALLTWFWWVECGHAWLDHFRLAAGCAPLALLLWAIDPLENGPMPL
jgi:protein-S-isoprenylcysteine O-methyltransferase Ste14